MRYSTTSLSAITLCVCMMLCHHTNGTDMWSTPSPFTNNNPNQIQMAGQQWNQQPNTNMQSGSNNWNNVATPMHLNNNQGQPQSSERLIIHTTTYPKKWDHVTIHFSGKYRFASLEWSKFSRHTQWQMKPTWKGQNFLVICYKGNEKYQRVKDFYDVSSYSYTVK
ncbi:hypothetical protein BDF22DRAFT_313328 [Syncephalis plumigaleata]|nr:hypothetical protein BDF22DRAFT_313328 [Syncephalis plumigaleata]